MFKNKKKILALTISALVLFLSFATSGYAATVQSTLKAQFVSFTMLFNGQVATPKDSLGNTVSPLLVNGTTYLPIRAFGDLFEKNIEWNNTLKQISITDKTTNELVSLKAELAAKEMEILILKSQLEGSEGDIDDLEEQLNDDYEDYEDYDWSITLSGDEDDIIVKVDIDRYDWDDLSSTQQNRIIQNICDDIADEFEDADITGDVKDSSRILESFEVKSNGDVEFESSGDLGDLEDYLNDEYVKLDTLSISSIELDGDEDDVIFTVNINYSGSSTNTSKWDALSSSTIKNFMAQIKSEILDEFEDAEVEGYVFDTNDNDDMAEYYESGGTFSLIRYLPY